MRLILSRKGIASLVFVTSILGPLNAKAEDDNIAARFVYVMTNESSGNAVVQYWRAPSGQLHRIATVSTRGVGSGGTVDPLGSQNSLLLTGDGQFVVAVNAGSNSISVLGAGRSALRLVSKSASGGEFPNSLAISGDLLYVLNSHGTPNITGFRLDPQGGLTAIPGSTRNLPGGAGSAPADVRFSQDGTLLLVTEPATNQIDVFTLSDAGIATNVTTTPSPGPTPFGFAFASHDRPIVTEAGIAALSSFDITNANELAGISANVSDTQKAACWISLNNKKNYGYVSNTGSGTISSYQIDDAGAVTLSKVVAGSLGSGSAPTDSAMSDDSQYLYVLDSAQGHVAAFQVNGANLVPIGTTVGLPKSIQGIAAQ